MPLGAFPLSYKYAVRAVGGGGGLQMEHGENRTVSLSEGQDEGDWGPGLRAWPRRRHLLTRDDWGNRTVWIKSGNLRSQRFEFGS